VNITLEIDENIEIREVGIHFYIKYTGPLGGQSGTKKIKVDISNDEILVFKPVLMPAIINYSDLSNHSLLCYTLEEVLVEKMRTIIQRMQARDFYDVWYLLEVYGMDPTFLITEFKTKCHHKNISPEQFHKKINERIPQYKGRWSNSMKDQIKYLPKFEQVEREIQRHLKRIVL
jgi:predicted nucleotidyltransferase component of viral defense system